MSKLQTQTMTNAEPQEEGEILDQILEATTNSIDKRESAMIEMQLTASFKRPRSIKNFIDLASQYATIDEETAASCSYSLPRGGKKIVGPSVRLAEICAMAWGNIHTDAHVQEIGDKFVKVTATCWDMQSNVRIGQEVARRITDSKGRRYNDDMIIMTINAATSIVLRNAIFRVIPKALVEKIRLKCMAVVRGDERTLTGRREEAIAYWAKQGIDEKRLLASVEKPSVLDIDLDDLLTLRGYAVAIRDKEATLEDCFPLPEKPEAKLPTKGGSLKQPTNGTPKAAESESQAPEAKPEPQGPVEGELPNDDTPLPIAKPDAFALGELRALCKAKGSPEETLCKVLGVAKFEDLDSMQVEEQISDLRAMPDVVAAPKAMSLEAKIALVKQECRDTMTPELGVIAQFKGVTSLGKLTAEQADEALAFLAKKRGSKQAK